MRVKNRVPIRRALAATLTLLMMLSMTVTAFAAEPDGPDDGFYPDDDPGVVFDGDDDSDGGYAEGIETGLADIPVQTEDGMETVPIETETTPADTETISETPPEDDFLPAVTGFSDVPRTHGFYTAIMDCAAKGITSGYADGTFRPTNPVTRAQFSVMLSRAFYPQQIGWFPNTDGDGQPWFAPNVKVLSSNGLLKDTSFINNRLNTGVMNQAISRYDMAQLMTNIMAKKGFSATSAQKTEAQKKISDYKSIPSQYQNAVKNVYALGIITGYSNGTFSGNNVMNRGQGCVVIYRMTKYTPAATTTPDVDDSGKPTGNTGNTETSSGSTGNTGTSSGNTSTNNNGTTLTNGKPITEANVLEIMQQLQKTYPTGTSFGLGYTVAMKQKNGSITGTNVSDALWSYERAEGGHTSVNAGCGGWAAFVSDSIFGTTDRPARKVDPLTARPGDIVIQLNSNNKLVHVAIVTKWDFSSGLAQVSTTDADSQGTHQTGQYITTWNEYGYTATPSTGATTHIEIWTRYPSNGTRVTIPNSSGGTGTSSSSSSTTTTTPNTQPSIQDLMAAPCGLCGKTGGGSVLNDAMTKKVCTDCHNHNRAAAIAYLNS